MLHRPLPLMQVAVGQSLQLRGAWVQHRQYGEQLRVTDMAELKPASKSEMAAYLGGGAIPGVGPATAQVNLHCYIALVGQRRD